MTKYFLQDAATTPVPPGMQEMLGPYPVLQFFAGLIVLTIMAFGAFAWLRGEKLGRDKKLALPEDPAAQMFFGGPLKAIFESLAVIQANVIAIQQTAATISGKQELNKLEFKDVLAQALSSSRHVVMNGLSEVQAELAGDIENHHRDSNKSIEKLEQEVRDLRETVVRIEAGLTRRR